MKMGRINLVTPEPLHNYREFMGAVRLYPILKVERGMDDEVMQLLLRITLFERKHQIWVPKEIAI